MKRKLPNMKKISLLLIIALVAGSCSLFEKPSMKQAEIDAMMAKNVQLQEDLMNAQNEASRQKMLAEECANVLAELQKVEEGPASGMYYVIAGSFKKPGNATDYSAKMKQSGGEGAIIDGPSNFKLVSYSSHGTLREAIKAMENARINVTDEAWVYMVK